MRARRRAHVLKRNHQNETVRYAVFFDAETRAIAAADGTQRLQFRLAVASFVRRDRAQRMVKRYTNPEDLFTDIEKFSASKTKVWVVSHNLYFDFKVCRFHVIAPQRGWKLESMYFPESGMQTFLQFRKNNRSLLFISSTNFFNASIKSLGDMLHLPKLDVDFDNVDDETLFTYCARDVEIVERAMCEFWSWLRDSDYGNVQKTIAAQALSIYRHRFMTQQIYIHDDARATQLERDSYHGGRVEAWRVGPQRAHLTLLDVNSMYPAVMRDHLYPRQLLRVLPAPSLRDVEEFLSSQLCCIARVVVETEEPVYAVKTAERLLFPVGRFTTTLTTPELVYAIAHDHVKRVEQCAVYSAAPLFADFVNEFYARRLAAKRRGDAVYAYFYKILMNSLYGKFGQRTQRSSIIGSCGAEEFQLERDITDARAVTEWRAFGAVIRFDRGKQEAYNSFPAISAHVTAHGRMLLWTYIVIAGLDNVYYCDTDSLIVNNQGAANLADFVDNERLGALKVEQTADTAYFYAPKDYIFGDVVKRKGVRKSAVSLNNDNEFVQEQWERIRTALRKQDRDDYVIRQQTKRLERVIKNRVVVDAQGRTAPILIDEDNNVQLQFAFAEREDMHTL